MQINVTWDTSVLQASVASEIESAVDYVVNLFDNLFTNPITINIDVGWGEVAGHALDANALGESISNVASYSYSQIRNALTNTANASGDPSQLAAASTLPATNPTDKSTFTISDAEAKALGLPLGLHPPAVDGYVGFAADPNIWSFSPTATPAFDQYYFVGVAEHEITEILGRVSDIGRGAYSLMDLFRYSSAGQRDLSSDNGTSPYFSIDGGTTNLGNWNNTVNSGDLGDWSSGPAPGGHDAFNASGSPGVINALSPDDVTLMNALGYDLAPQCFLAGTLIRTADGEIPVERLSRGALMATADGRAVPATWIGRRIVSARFADPLRFLPIRIKAGALGDNSPARDLLLSPDHAIFLDGVLAHAGALVNGSSIVREHNVPAQFAYYHVETDDHSLILAENTPAETFIDNDGRRAFDNWQEFDALRHDGAAAAELPYPRAKAHRQVPRKIRDKLAERAARLMDVQRAA